MERPTLEEVKEYFKDAKKIESCYGEKLKYKGAEAGFVENTFMNTGSNNATIWNPDKGYAKILSYKEPKEKTYKITREQILEIHNNTIDQLVRNKLKNTYPSVFETKLVEFNKWVVTPDYPKWIVKYDKDNDSFYGLNINGDWFHAELENRNPNQISKFREATSQEVEQALNHEIKKKYKIGDYVKSMKTGKIYRIDSSRDGIMDGEYFVIDDICIFKNGVFAEIIPTLTIQEAEAKLNCKII